VLPNIDWIEADLAQMTDSDRWRPHLADIEVIVNASGLLQTGDGGSIAAVQFGAIAALIEAAEAECIAQFIQISAAGADPGASGDFMRTKADADALLASSRLQSVVFRPGLVIGRNSYGGTELIRTAAASPVALRLPLAAPIQCVALSDVVTAVDQTVANRLSSRSPIDFVERTSRPVNEVIDAHRRWLALQNPRFSLAVPRWSLSAASWISDGFGLLGWRSPLRSNAYRSILRGVSGDANATAAFLGREPLSLDETLAQMPAGKQDRVVARLNFILPLILLSLFLLWFASGSIALLDPSAAQRPLLSAGLAPAALRWLVMIGGVADIILSIALIWRRTARTALLGMVLLTGVYLVAGVILTPGLWVDPLAPLLKSIPAALLTLTAFWLIEKR